DVKEDDTAQPPPIEWPKKGEERDRSGKDAREARQGGAALGLGHERLEQAQGKLRQKHGQDRREACPNVRSDEVIERLCEVPEARVGGERRKPQLRHARTPAKHDRDCDREGEGSTKERGLST